MYRKTSRREAPWHRPKKSLENRRLVKRTLFQQIQRQLVRWPQHFKDFKICWAWKVFNEKCKEHLLAIWNTSIKTFRLLTTLKWFFVRYKTSNLCLISCLHPGICAGSGKLFTLDTSTLNGRSVGVEKGAFGLNEESVMKVNTVFTFVSSCLNQERLIWWKVCVLFVTLRHKHLHGFVSSWIKHSPVWSHSYPGPNRCSVLSRFFNCHGHAVILISILRNCQSSTGQFTTFPSAEEVVPTFTVSNQCDIRMDALCFDCKNEVLV